MTSYIEVPPASYHPLVPYKGPAKREAPPRLGLPSIKYPPSLPPKKPSQIAWDAYRICTPSTKHKYGKIILDFCTYMDMCDNSAFAAEGISMSGKCRPYNKLINTSVPQRPIDHASNDYGKRKISGPLLNRWHPQRRMQWLARMHQLALWYEANRIDGCTFISLTGYQENSGLSIYDTWDNINESRKKILKILRKVFPKLSYFWVVEPHTENNTGYPHYHLAVFRNIDNNIRDSYGEGMEDKLRRLYSKEWQTGSHTYGLDFQVMEGDKSIKDLKNYLMKYISKGYVNDAGWGEAELIFNAHLYGATHDHRPPKPGELLDYRGQYSKKYRLIGMSRDLSALLKPEEEEKEQIIWLHTEEVEPQEIKGEDGEIELWEKKNELYHRLLIPDFTCYDVLASDIKTRKPAKYGYIHHDPKIRPVNKRQMETYNDPFRPVWDGIYRDPIIKYDPTAARKLRNKDTSG